MLFWEVIALSKLDLLEMARVTAGSTQGFLTQSVSLPSDSSLDSCEHDVVVQDNEKPESAFPFLELPGEIRNQIYELVFGDDLYHVDGGYEARSDDATGATPNYRPWMSRCQLNDNAPENTVQETVQEPGNRRKPTEWLTRHLECAGSKDSKRSLNFYDPSLLLTCRQIYHEARHVPFQSSTFAFLSRTSLEKFVLHSLQESQAAAMRKIVLFMPIGDMSRHSPETQVKFWAKSTDFDPQVVERLSGPLKITLNVSFYHANLQDLVRSRLELWEQGILIGGLQDLKQLNIRRAVVKTHDARCKSACCTTFGVDEFDIKAFEENICKQILS